MTDRQKIFALRAVWSAVAIGVSVVWAQAFTAGIGRLMSVCHVASACSSYQLDGPASRVLTDHGIPLALYAGITAVVTVGAWLVWFGLGVLLVWRRPRDRGAYISALFLAVFPLMFASLWAATTAQTKLFSGIAIFSLIPLLLLFPNGRFVPRWTWVFLTFVSILVAYGQLTRGHLLHKALGPFGAVIVLLIAMGLQIHRFRSISSWRERQQTKWATLGLCACVIGFAATLLPILIGKVATNSLYSDFVDILLALTTSAIPITLAIAVLRSGLWDVDHIISRALAYAVLSAVIVGAYIGGVVGLQSLFALFVHNGSPPAIALSTLAIVASFGPLRRRIQHVVDRRFYRSRYDASLTLAAFGKRLRDQVDLGELSHDLTGVVHETLHPEHVSLRLRAPG